jgi:hypothetical protein
MFDNSSLIAQSNQRQSKALDGFGIVYDVILDENHPLIKDKDLDTSLIGAIRFRYSSRPADNDEELPVALPFDKTLKTLPVRNEGVEIYKNYAGEIYYRRIGPESSTNGRLDETYISRTFKPGNLPEDKTKGYSKSFATGISIRNTDEQAKYDGFGDYFEKQAGIHKLKLYEGDSIIESRFGQSIRFSGYNNSNNDFSPTTIIRNGENNESRKNSLNVTTEEDVNRDGSVIVLSSNTYTLPFIPGVVSDRGRGDFETKPNSFKDYPQRLVGDQMLLNSGRIILSAKTGELIIYSKKNYGFISDGGLSIDNKLGLTINLGDVTNITTNDRDVNINTGNGKINLGDKNLESLVRGETLVNLLNELIDAIAQQVYLTPSGPTSPGPTNLPTFQTIKSKLNTMLSDLNKTS